MNSTYSLERDVYPLLKLAIPFALTGFVQSAVWFFETIFLAHLSPEILAAGSLVGWLFGTIAVILFGALSSINILVAYKYGEKDENSIALIARDGLLLALLLTIPTFFLLWNMAPVFLLFGQSEAIVHLAKSYLQALSFGILANFLAIACFEVIIGLGHTRVIFICTVISVVLNVFWSYVLIFGKYGFPALGIAGAGWGTTVGNWLTMVILFFFIIVNKNYRTYFRYTFCFSKPIFLGELLQIGVPIGFMYCAEVAFFFALTLCMGILGSDVQAANQVALQYLALFMSAVFAIAQAVTVRIGHSLGAREIEAADKASDMGIFISLTMTILVAFVYWFFPNPLIALDFNVHAPHNALLILLIKKILIVCAVFQIFESIRISLFGSLRGLKDTKFTLITSLFSFWGIALPLGYMFGITFHFGSVGFWWGMVMGAALSTILLKWRFNAKINYYRKLR